MGKRLADLCITAVYTAHNYIKLFKILKFNLSIDYVKVKKKQQQTNETLRHTPRTRWLESACLQPQCSCCWARAEPRTGSTGARRRGGWRGRPLMRTWRRCGCGRRVGNPACSSGCSRGVRMWPTAAGWQKSGRESRGPTPESWCSTCYRRTRSPSRPSPDLTGRTRGNKQEKKQSRYFGITNHRCWTTDTNRGCYLWRGARCSRQRPLPASWTVPAQSPGRRLGCLRWTQTAGRGSGRPLQQAHYSHGHNHHQAVTYTYSVPKVKLYNLTARQLHC